MKILLALKNINIIKNNDHILRNISFSVKKGEKIALLGPSGSGKSSIMKVANGTLMPTNGESNFCGIKTTMMPRHIKRQIGTLWQELRLIDELSVSQNINSGALGRHGFFWAFQNLLGLIDPKETINCLKASELTIDLLNKSTKDLSAGQRKRVAIARLLNQHSNIILADEPLSSLDPILSNKILKTLLNGSKFNLVPIAETCIISLHQPELISEFTRVIGVKFGEIIMDKPSSCVKQNDLIGLYN